MADKPKPETKAKPKKFGPQEAHLASLETRLKNLEYKRDHKIQHFTQSEGRRDQAAERVDQHIIDVKKLITKAKKKFGKAE